MTTGPPLYLVSACGSAEEFVAAFRRYADRTGLFVPSTSPLPAGKRGRLALTLKDGGVMIEGEAEILQSSTKPTVLHGRPGMTVKFVEPDELSKIVIGELEKARLAMKPAPPSVPPRPAQIPAEPRPVPPAPSGRIDAANALAECIVIGDVSTLKDTANAPKLGTGLGGAVNDRSASKFVVPAIPAVGAPRPKTPSTAPAASSTPTVAPAPSPPAPAAAPPVDKSRMTALGLPVVEKVPVKTESGRVVSNATTLGMPAIARKPDAPVSAAVNLDDDQTTIGTAAPKKPTDSTIPATPIAPLLDGDDEPTAFGVIPTKKPTDPRMPAAAPAASPAPPAASPARPVAPAAPSASQTAPPASPPSATPVAARADAENPRRTESAKNHKATSIGFPVVRSPFETQPLGVVPPASPSAFPGTQEPRDPAPPTLPKSQGRPAPGPRGKTPTTPPLTPRHPTPVAPVPIVRPPAKSAPALADDEKTDLGAAPPVVPVELAPTAVNGPIDKPAQRSGGMRASEILAAIPAGDWTMTPDESMPHPLPPEAKVPGPVIAEPTPAPAPPPKGPPTGDWTMSLDPDSGWSEPEKLARSEAPTKGNPVVAVASDKPINVVEWDEKPTGIGESKIEIDSTLMEPFKAMPNGDGTAPQPVLADSGSFDTQPPPLGPTPPHPAGFARQEAPAFMQGAAARPMPPYPTASSMDMRKFGSSARLPTPPDAAKRKKMIAMAIGAGIVAIGAIVVLVLTLSGKGKPPSQAKTGPGSAIASKATPSADAAVAAPGAGSQQMVEPAGSDSETPAPRVAPADAAVEQVAEQPNPPPVEDPKPAAGGTCNVQLTSVPAGADIYVDKRKLGTTPGKLELPCGKETKVSLRKSKFANTVRGFTPQTGKLNRFVFKLARNTVSVKVTSTPAGATITTGGKSVGVTPTTIKLPAYDSTTITLTKPGYSAEKSRVTPKQNNASHHVTLKKGR